MFDPLFPLLLLGGPIFLVTLLWTELRRTTASLRPKFETYILGFMAAFGISQWIIILILERYGEGMSEGQFNLVALLAFIVAGVVVVVSYLAAAIIRKRRQGRLIQNS